MTGLIFGILGAGLTFTGGALAMGGCTRMNTLGQRASLWLFAFVLLLIGTATLPHWLFSIFVGLGLLGEGVDHMRRVRGME